MRRTSTRTALVAVALALSAGTLVAPASAAPPAFASGHGITVLGVDQLSERTLRVRISSSAITAPDQISAADRALSVLVRLPRGYTGSTQRYPSLYLLHGRGSNAQQLRPAVEIPALDDQQLITIAPEGGRGSWYTNWVNEPNGKAQWETFHINQVIPWVDANLRTLASGENRAIAGFSMGGYGAMHYAFKHPSTFNQASSYSGGVDLENQLVRVAVLGTPAAEGFAIAPREGTGPFGNPIWPWDTIWKRENPVRHAEQLRGTNISLYAGSGNIANPVSAAIEIGANQATRGLNNRLGQLNIPRYSEFYANGASAGGFTCDGGHNDTCFKMALSKDVPRIMNSIR